MFEGWVSGDARFSLLRNATLFALLSSQENFGVALVEALACGTPAIVTREVNLATDIETSQAGWIVPRDPAGLAEALGRVMRDRAALADRRARARTFAGSFRWGSVAATLTGLYEDILSRRAATSRHLGTIAEAPYRAWPGESTDR